jgi:hypothetical protein
VGLAVSMQSKIRLALTPALSPRRGGAVGCPVVAGSPFAAGCAIGFMERERLWPVLRHSLDGDSRRHCQVFSLSLAGVRASAFSNCINTA